MRAGEGEDATLSGVLGEWTGAQGTAGGSIRGAQGRWSIGVEG